MKLQLLKKKGIALGVSLAVLGSLFVGQTFSFAAVGDVLGSQGFETVTSDGEWKGYGEGTISTEEAHESTKSVNLHVGWMGFGDQGRVLQSAVLQKNTNYELSFWALGNAGSFNIMTPNSATADEQIDLLPGGGFTVYHEWEKITYQFKTGESSALVTGFDGACIGKPIAMYIISGAAGELYIDDFAITEIEEPTATPSPEPTATVAPTDVPTDVPTAGTKPGKVAIKSAKNSAKKAVKVTLKKIKAKGYEYSCSLKKKFPKKGLKKATTTKATFTFKKLAKKTYYIRARAYNLKGKTKVWGAYSKVKTVKVKK